MDAAFRLLEAEYEIDIVKGRKETSAGHKQAFKPFAIGAGLKEQSELDIVLDGKDEDDELHSSETRSYQLFDHYVDADTFSSWWSSFDARLTKGLDPVLCRKELLGTIKGCEASVDSPFGYLSLEECKQLSERASATYHDLRPVIYKIFEAYQKRKAANGHFHKADRTHALIRALRRRPLPSHQQLSFVAVDESQDLLLADAALLR